jgi:tripartite-type tricarboxylate transporter receptor subunit TctC
LSGPKGLPSGIVQKLNRAVAAALDLETVKRQLVNQTVEVKLMSPEETTKFYEREAAEWRPVAIALRGGQSLQ